MDIIYYSNTLHTNTTATATVICNIFNCNCNWLLYEKFKLFFFQYFAQKEEKN